MKALIASLFLAAVALTAVPTSAQPASSESSGEWQKLMDGTTFKNWKKTEENPDTWKIEDGAFVAHGKRGHLFYDGPGLPFKNFELKADVKTTSGSNGGIYIHTQYQPSGWPVHGYEIQVNQTHSDWRKSGSIYAVNDVKEQHVQDDEWYNYHVIVNGKRIIVKMNDKVVNDWTEEADRKPGADFTRILTSGTICLQAHDPKSVVHYKNIEVKKLD